MNRRVLVAGAGIGGLAFARAARDRGIEATVVERRPALPESGFGLNLPGNAMRALGHLGVDHEVAEAGVPVEQREYRSASGRLLFAVDERAFWADVAPSVCVRHHHLLEALARGIDVRHGIAVDHLTAGDDAVAAHLSDGRTEAYDFVVGADGVHSSVRSAVGGAAPRRSQMTPGSWRFITGNPGVDCWTAWTGHGALFLLIPVAVGEVYGYASSSRGRPVDHPEWLRATFSRFPAPVTRAVDQVGRASTSPYYAPLEEVRMSRWHRGRVALLGDAAHATSPVWAQGVAMAVEDALILATLLAARDDWSAVGAEWEALRRPRVEHVQSETDRLARLAGLPTWLSHAVAPVAGPRAYRSTYRPLRDDPLATWASDEPEAGT